METEKNGGSREVKGKRGHLGNNENRERAGYFPFFLSSVSHGLFFSLQSLLSLLVLSSTSAQLSNWM